MSNENIKPQQLLSKLKGRIEQFKHLFNRKANDKYDEPDEVRRAILKGVPTIALGAKGVPNAIAGKKIDFAKNAALLREFIYKGPHVTNIISTIAGFNDLKTLNETSVRFLDAILTSKDLKELWRNNSYGLFGQLTINMQGVLFDFDALARNNFKQFLDTISFPLTDTERKKLHKLEQMTKQGSINETLKNVRQNIIRFVERVINDISKDETLLTGRHGEIVPALKEFLYTNWHIADDILTKNQFMEILSQLEYFNMKLDFMLSGKIPNEKTLKKFEGKRVSFENQTSILSNHYYAIQTFAKKLAAKGQILALQSLDLQKTIIVDPKKHEHFKTAFNEVRKESTAGFVLARQANTFSVNTKMS